MLAFEVKEWLISSYALEMIELYLWTEQNTFYGALLMILLIPLEKKNHRLYSTILNKIK